MPDDNEEPPADETPQPQQKETAEDGQSEEETWEDKEGTVSFTKQFVTRGDNVIFLGPVQTRWLYPVLRNRR